MDKRNNRIHGNCNPEKEQIELVYFEGKTPLFKEPGDNIGKFIEAQTRQYDPESVIKDYEDVYAFILEIIGALHPNLVQTFRQVVADPYPGYDAGREKMGSVLPRRVAVGCLEGDRYDDELTIT